MSSRFASVSGETFYDRLMYRPSEDTLRKHFMALVNVCLRLSEYRRRSPNAKYGVHTPEGHRDHLRTPRWGHDDCFACGTWNFKYDPLHSKTP